MKRRINIGQIIKDIIRCFRNAILLSVIIVFVVEFSEPINNIIDKYPIVQIINLFVIVNILVLIIFQMFSEFTRWTIWYDVKTINIDDNDKIGKAEKFADLDKETKRRTYVHEVGHAVAASILGMKGIKIVLNAENPRVEVENPTTRDSDTVKKLIMIRYSGAIAEELVYGNFDFGSCICEGSDFVSAIPLLKAYLVMTNDTVSKAMLGEKVSEKVNLLSDKLYQDATNMLKEYKKIIEELADMMLDGEKLTEATIDGLMERKIHE